MGDGLIKLPFCRALRHAFPDAHITWLAGKGPTAYAGRLAPLVAGLIDEVVSDAGVGTRVAELVGAPPLGGRGFDLVIDTQRRLLTTLILRRVPHRRFVSGCAGFRLSDIRPAPGHTRPPAMLGQLLELAALARHGRADAPLDLGGAVAVPPQVAAAAQDLLPAEERHVGLAPGAGERAKCWPVERFAALAGRLRDAGMTPVFLLGPDDGDLEAPLRAALPGARFPLADAPDAARAAEPLLTIALARRCACCVANDSGSGHIFAAAGVPLVSLFGPTAPEKFAPAADPLRILRAQDFGGAEMAAIPVDAVLGAVAELAGG